VAASSAIVPGELGPADVAKAKDGEQTRRIRRRKVFNMVRYYIKHKMVSMKNTRITGASKGRPGGTSLRQKLDRQEFFEHFEIIVNGQKCTIIMNYNSTYQKINMPTINTMHFAKIIIFRGSDINVIDHRKSIE
jgi:hypothetical protein